MSASHSRFPDDGQHGATPLTPSSFPARRCGTGTRPWRIAALALAVGMALSACSGGGAGNAGGTPSQPGGQSKNNPSEPSPTPGGTPQQPGRGNGSTSPGGTTGPSGNGGSQAGSNPNSTGQQGGNGNPGLDPGGAGNTQRPAPAGPGLCNDLLPSVTPLLAGMTLYPLPDTPRPDWLVPTQDPTYRSCVVRITDNRAQYQSDGTTSYRRNDYSRRQAFNADSSRFLLEDLHGFWYVYDALTGRPLKKLDELDGDVRGLAGDAEPYWHPTDPNRLYFIPTNGVGMQIYELDLAASRVSTVANMGPQIRQIWPDADMAYTKSEGSPSADGRYWCFMARHYTDSSDQPMRGIFTWDLQERRIVGAMNLDSAPDHVSMSPSGQYCVVSHDGEMGTRAYNRTFSAPYNAQIAEGHLQLHHKSEHSDLALDAQGLDTYVSLDYQSNVGDVFMINLDTGKRTVLFPSYLNRTAMAFHISGKAYGKPGWVLMSTYGEHFADDPSTALTPEQRQWAHRRMFAVSLTESPEIRHIAAIHPNVFRYEDEPHGTVNHDFTRMLFNTTWDGQSVEDMEVYMVELPAGALDGAR